MSTGNFISAVKLLDGLRDDVLGGTPPTFYPIGKGQLSQIEVGPGLVTLIGGAPAAGKTAFTMQAIIDAVRLKPTVRALVCNVEMPSNVLMERQLARLSGVDLTEIRYRRISNEAKPRIESAIATLGTIANRICFLRNPFSLTNIGAAADNFGANLILLDYIQRIAPPVVQENRRGQIDAVMDYLRQFADHGAAVMVVSAVARSKDERGRSSYGGSGLSLASFRESSELEYGADDAFILVQGKTPGTVVLRHLKSRHGEARDVTLNFNGRVQSFTDPAGPSAFSTVDPAKEFAEQWESCVAADEEVAG